MRGMRDAINRKFRERVVYDEEREALKYLPDRELRELKGSRKAKEEINRRGDVAGDVGRGDRG